MSGLEGKKILLISGEAWGKSFVSKHHYATYLSKKNTVYFLNPVNRFSKIPLVNLSFQHSKINDDLILINYVNPVPRLNNLPKKVQALLYKNIAKKIQRKIGIDEWDIVWSFDPMRFWNWDGWKTKFKLYHTVDVHFNARFENEIATKADLIITTADSLIEPLKKFNQNIHKISHGADIDNFKENLTTIKLPGGNLVKAGLIGIFNKNIDYDLIHKCATENLNVDFCLVGPMLYLHPINDKIISNKIAELKNCTNVFFTGEVPSSTIIFYLNSFDINLVLYREARRDIIIGPHKLMGYFFSGNVTISSYIDEYKTAPTELILMGNHNADIPSKITEVVSNLKYHNSIANKLLRRTYAEENSYDKQIERISKLIEPLNAKPINDQ